MDLVDRLELLQNRNDCEKMAGTTRLELAASGVTGRRYNQLNYVPALRFLFMVGGTGFEPATPGL